MNLQPWLILRHLNPPREQAIFDMPIVRDFDLVEIQEGQPNFFQYHDEDTRMRLYRGALLYTRGSRNRGDCTNCMDFPLFQTCVSLTGKFDGVCASCHAKNIGSTCSLREQNGESCYVVVGLMLTYSLGSTGSIDKGGKETAETIEEADKGGTVFANQQVQQCSEKAISKIEAVIHHSLTKRKREPESKNASIQEAHRRGSVSGEVKSKVGNQDFKLERTPVRMCLILLANSLPPRNNVSWTSKASSPSKLSNPLLLYQRREEKNRETE